jgi:Cof subfamily protein (haloacid dehalogenase superfamily)
MIKLIASDLDGTLLQNNNREISSQMIQIIEKLHEKGILFVAASGRQYPNMYRLFAPVSKHMAFICENGGLVMYKDQVLSKTPMERTLGLELIKDIWNQKGCEILLSGIDTSYMKPKNDNFYYLMKDLVKNNVTLLNDFSEVTEEFLKISVFEEAGIANNSGPYFINKWQDLLKCTISGHGWLDFTAPCVNKGNALSFLLNKLSLNSKETMAFGDNYNDLEMLSLAEYGYVLDNANEDIKKQYKYHTKSVEETIIKHFNL